MEWDAWIDLAWKVRDHAYAPYSRFKVGAVVVAGSGELYLGCNVENLSYGLTQCAERVAIGSAVAAGETEILQVVVVAETTEPISPCGACRQVMAEFGNPSVLLANRTAREIFPLVDLLPRSSTGILDRA